MNLAASLGQCASPSHFLRLGPQATSPPPNNLIPECLDGGVAESKDSCTIWAEANSAVSQACGHVTSEHTQKQGWHGRRLGWRKAVPAVAQWASCPWASADDCSHAGVWALSHHTFNLKESLKSWFSYESSQFLNIGFKKKKTRCKPDKTHLQAGRAPSATLVYRLYWLYRLCSQECNVGRDTLFNSLALSLGVLLHSGHDAGSGCSVCVWVSVCVWLKTHRLAPGPATQPSHLHTHKVPSQGSRFPCWELSQLGAQGHTPKGCRKKRSLGLWWTYLERGSSSLRAPVCTDLCGPRLAPQRRPPFHPPA